MFCVATRLFGSMHWVWSFAQMLCGALFVFLFMKLQLVGVTIGWCFLVYFGLKKPFEDFCDFVFVCGLKLLEELNFNEGLDPKVMEKQISTKEGLCFFSQGPLSLFSLSFFFPLSLFGRINRRWQWGAPLMASLEAWVLG